MDTSVEYIEMCEKAQEIQKDWYENEEFADVIWEEWRRPFPGGYIKGITFWVDNCHGQEFPDRADLKWVWLPRQDQLQEMIYDFTENEDDDYYNVRFSIEELWDYINTHETIILECKSLEQLWLMYAMYKVYNKQWNPETKEWEKV